MHLRTKRKPNKKNISRLIFSIVLTFILMIIIFSLGSIKKENFIKNKNNINAPTSTNIISTSTQKVEIKKEVKEYWNLNVDQFLLTSAGEKIFIEIADTKEKQEQGLSGKNKLMEFVKDNKIETEGMLFVFEKPEILNFWMKDMKFDLDMIWLDENFKIVHIEKNALASSYDKNNPSLSKIFSNNESGNLAKYVLEINSGLTNKMNLKIGDSLILR
jgi:uncharacterized membrane protein (UPF0127 family)